MFRFEKSTLGLINSEVQCPNCSSICQSVFLGAHIWQLTTACNSSSRVYDTLHTQNIKVLKKSAVDIGAFFFFFFYEGVEFLFLNYPFHRLLV